MAPVVSPEELRAMIPNGKGYFDFSLPPLHRLEDIFKDLTEKALSNGLETFLKFSSGRPLRVATMCSGTESPLLALNMVKEALKSIGTDLSLSFEHVFSCEIVPYKQAYIERTCRPPLLFRDITEMGNDKAYTAYGVLAKVPSNLDVLIAGTACVDFSTLNSKRKKLGEGGESSKTFFGLVDYVQHHSPSMVILENVKGQKEMWDRMTEEFDNLGYSSVVMKVDTKYFYLPQTRERKYMVAIKNGSDPIRKAKSKSALTEIKHLVDNVFPRPASSPSGYFLLHEDDRRMNQIINDRDLRLKKDRAKHEWERAKIIHANEREGYHLGPQRPVTMPAGTNVCKGPEFYKHSWFEKRAEREMDLLDIFYLKAILGLTKGAKELKDDFPLDVSKGYDMHYKEKWIDLSQGVDRASESTKSFGNIGCVTPRGTSFCTSRGGPLTGQEALAIQGLPLSRMIFTRESQEELQELAGNAMTSTVVCAVTLAVLIKAHPLLDGSPRPPPRHHLVLPDWDDNLQKARFEEGTLDDKASPFTSSDVAAAEPAECLRLPNLCDNIPKLQNLAKYSSRYCHCEEQAGSQYKIYQCANCGATVCELCNRDPPHGPTTMAAQQRQEPLDFMKRLRESLPMRLHFSGLNESLFAHLYRSIPESQSNNKDEPATIRAGRSKKRGDDEQSTSSGRAAKRRRRNRSGSSTSATTTESTGYLSQLNTRLEYKEAVVAALRDIVCFVDMRRAETWTVSYEGPNSTLKLLLGPKSTQWHLFAKPPASAPARSLIREILAKPIAKMTCGTKLLQGTWKINQPISTTGSVRINGVEDNEEEDRLPAYAARCGITLRSVAEEKVWKKLSVTSVDCDNIEYDINGTYELLPNCGTALGSLYKRDGGQDEPATFLFFDPQKCSDVQHDSFVFAFEHRRIADYSRRITIAELPPDWRPKDVTRDGTAVNLFYGVWEEIPEATLNVVTDSNVFCEFRRPNPSVTFVDGQLSDELGSEKISSEVELRHAYNLLFTAKGPVEALSFRHDDSDEWKHHDIERSPEVLEGITWALDQASSRTGSEGWRDVRINGSIHHDSTTICEICHPKIPTMRRVRQGQEGHEEENDVEDEGNTEAEEEQTGRRTRKAAKKRSDNSNNQEAIKYERLMKTKQPKWILRTRILNNTLREIHVGLNIRVMMHIACERMLQLLKGKRPEARWKLTLNSFDVGRKYHGKFKLKNTQDVSPRPGLPGFLRPEQLKSLDWMIDQEDPNIEPFNEMEVVEATLPIAAWRAEVKVTAQTNIRGGLCADEVGFGKTALILGLIQYQWTNGWNEFAFNDTVPGLDSLRATLIIAPSNIMQQWLKEIENFISKEYLDEHVVEIRTGDMRKKASQIREARIVLVNINVLVKPSSAVAKALLKYRWARLVIDEYHLLWDKKENAADLMISLNAYSKWLLSGTPGLEDFASVKSIATLLGAHLGIDDDGDIPSKSKRLSRVREKYSDLEKLQMFQPVHSEHWYKDRRDLAQSFLNRFARQNPIDGSYPRDVHYDCFQLSADERRVYSILANRLKTQSNLSEISAKSKEVSAGLRACFNGILKCARENDGGHEHALMLSTTSATFTSSPYNALICQDRIKALDKKLKAKWKDLKDKCEELMKMKYEGSYKELWKSIKADLEDAHGPLGFGNPDILIHVCFIIKKLYNAILEKADEDQIVPWALMDEEDAQDPNLQAEVPVEMEENSNELAEDTNLEPDGDGASAMVDPSEDEEEEYDEEDDDDGSYALDEQQNPQRTFAEEVCHEIKCRFERIAKIHQEKRFWTSAKELQPGARKPEAKCSACSEKFGGSRITILRSCGHALCAVCLTKIENERCPTELCSGTAAQSELFDPDDFLDVYVSKHSSKLKMMIDIINNQTQMEEQVIVLCQYPKLFEMIHKTLADAGIESIYPKKNKVDVAIEKFKQRGGQGTKPAIKVLILHLGGEDIAGQNLQCANHLIFLNTRLADTQAQYAADMNQAIGRVCRPGQTRLVNLHYLLAEKTADVSVFEKFTGENILIRRDPIQAQIKRKSDEWLGVEDERNVRRRIV